MPQLPVARLPHILELLPGLRWQGKLKILAKLSNGHYAVQFDAEAPKAHVNERIVYDRTVLTPEQLKDWTGFSEES